VKSHRSLPLIICFSLSFSLSWAQTPTDRCSALEKLQIENTTIAKAELIPVGTPIEVPGFPAPTTLKSLPSHCRVTGEVNHHRGKDGKEYGDRFEVRMPIDWSSRLLFQGGVALDGVLFPAIGMLEVNAGTSPDSALSRGYAVVATDGGHESSGPMGIDGSFGADPDARADYNYRSTRLVMDAVRNIVAQFYGHPADHSYLKGCSNGGREALIAVQRYPEYFDGVIAGRTRSRERKRHKLAPGTVPEREVKKMAAEFLRPMNQGLAPIGSATKFEEYVETVYQSTLLPVMAKSTRDRYQGVIRNYLVPAFGSKCLRDLTTLTLQQYFSQISKRLLSYESQDKIRDVLSSILGSAVTYGLLVKNPIEGVRLSPAKRGRRVKPYIDPIRFLKLVASIPEPYATMVYVAVYTGLRVSELIGLKWKNVHADAITVEERYCRGEWGAPKSDSSNATIAVNSRVIERIHWLKTVTLEIKAGAAVRRYPAVKSSGPDDLVFASVVKGLPMRDNNILCRFIKPAARTLGMGWVNWQVLRRSHATWLKLAGADIKDAQAQMRHSRVTTTLEIYQQFVPESQRRAVQKLHELTGTGVVN
jgi:integrase